MFCELIILILKQIIVLNIILHIPYPYNKPIPKISRVETLRNLCKMR